MSRPQSSVVMERRQGTQTRRFPHTCDIWRAAITGTNERGETEYAAAARIASVGCLLWNPASGRGEQFTPERDTVTNAWRAHLPAGADVLTSDTIRNVRDQLGDVVGVELAFTHEPVRHPSVTLLHLERVN